MSCLGKLLLVTPLLLLSCSPISPPARGETPSNAIWVTDESGKPQRERPITIGRIFARGEIPQSVQAAVDGKRVPTQCDVKTRWSDGSVKHAILTFTTSIASRGSRVEFVNHNGPIQSDGLSLEDMLNFNGGDWDAGMELTVSTAPGSVETRRVSAREMLEKLRKMSQTQSTGADGAPAGKRMSPAGSNAAPAGAMPQSVQYWLRGPLCTQVIVTDASPDLVFDLGWEATVTPARSATKISATADSIEVTSDDAKYLNAWKTPLTVAVDEEFISVCSIQGNTLMVCDKGRGIDGSTATRHNSGSLTIPDQGWKAASQSKFRSLHPIMVLTFYAGWKGVKADIILEDAWMDKLQDQIYRLRLLKGHPLVNTGYDRRVMHLARARWRKTVWSGEEPGQVNIDHNLAYLIYTGAIPNFDPSVKVTSSDVSSEVNSFDNGDRGDIGGNGRYGRYFPRTGGRPELGIFPEWTTRYLYTFDKRLWPVVLGNADVAAHVPMHYRESQIGRSYAPITAFSATDAFARPVSVDARKLFSAGAPEKRYPDGIQFAGTITTAGWAADRAHQPDFVYVPYLVTGDWFFLDELYFWASFDVALNNPDKCDYCRHEDWGYMYDQPRGEAWAMRCLGHAAFFAPDGSPEKAYFLNKLNNNIAIHEGMMHLTTGKFFEPCHTERYSENTETSKWCWGFKSLRQGLDNPLRFLSIGVLSEVQGLDTSVVAAGASPWMYNYVHIIWGHLEELGFDQIAPLRQWAAYNLLGQLQDPGYNPFLADDYRMPVRRKGTNMPYFDNWKDVQNAIVDKNQNSFSPGNYLDIAYAASTFLVGLEIDDLSGQKAWQLLRQDVQFPSGDPRYALLPRVDPASKGTVALGFLDAKKWKRWQRRSSPPN